MGNLGFTIYLLVEYTWYFSCTVSSSIPRNGYFLLLLLLNKLRNSVWVCFYNFVWHFIQGLSPIATSRLYPDFLPLGKENRLYNISMRVAVWLSAMLQHFSVSWLFKIFNEFRPSGSDMLKRKRWSLVFLACFFFLFPIKLPEIRAFIY